MLSLAALLFVQVAPPPPEPPTEEVVVVARKRRCEVSIADRILSNRAFRARAQEWRAGTPVRVVVADGANYRCLARIAFRLHNYGVTRIVFD